MPATEQTYANHRYRPALWLTGALSALAVFIMVVVLVSRDASLLAVTLLLMAYALVVATFNVRRFAIKLQDRIIRLEMQTRLARCGREADLDRLSMRQIVALRFASDAELPALLQRAVAENLSDDQIKKAVTAWQADHLRT